MKVTYLKDTIKTTVNVKTSIKTSKITVKKISKKFALKAILKINGESSSRKLITFEFNGKTYKKGIAQKTLNNNVIKKLKKGREYKVKVTYGKDFVITTVKVKKNKGWNSILYFKN